MLTDSERDRLDRHCALLAERLAAGLVRVRLFGSAAPDDERTRDFLEQVAEDEVDVWSSR
jgi:hypothetical protein